MFIYRERMSHVKSWKSVAESGGARAIVVVLLVMEKSADRDRSHSKYYTLSDTNSKFRRARPTLTKQYPAWNSKFPS